MFQRVILGWITCVVLWGNQSPVQAQSPDAIIQQAISLKAQNALPDTILKYHSYTKTVLRFPEYFPVDTLLGRTIMPFLNRKKPLAERKSTRRPSWLPPELDSEILFLSENLSQVITYPPRHFKEEITYSRVSGELTRFSFVGSLVTQFNPYQNGFGIPGITARKIISPLADRAFFYYTYTLLDSTHNGYEFGILPKQKHAPCFEGTILLDKESLAVKQVDLFVTQARQLDFLDTLWIHQQYALWESKWVPVLSEFDATFSLNLMWLKVPFIGKSVSAISKYETDSLLPSHFTKGEILKVASHTSQAGNAAFDTLRPIPLTALEQKDYHLKDSLHDRRTSRPYLDSLTRTQNKVSLPNIILLGQKFKHFRKHIEISVEHLLSSADLTPWRAFLFAPILRLNGNCQMIRN